MLHHTLLVNVDGPWLRNHCTMTQPDLVSNLIHIYKSTTCDGKRDIAYALLDMMSELDGDWAKQVITRIQDLAKNAVGQCTYCLRPAAGPSHTWRHTDCLINEPKAMYKLPKINRKHICPICCHYHRSYNETAKHMLDLHSMREFMLIGIQPYMLARVFDAGKAAVQHLWDPLNKFVTEYVFPKPPSGRTSARNLAVAPNAVPQAIQINMANFIFDTSPELALLKAIHVLPPFTAKPFQSSCYQLDVDPISGLRRYFYPCSFFDDSAFACGGWINLLRNFHLFQ